jgi:hypothetical protein
MKFILTLLIFITLKIFEIGIPILLPYYLGKFCNKKLHWFNTQPSESFISMPRHKIAHWLNGVLLLFYFFAVLALLFMITLIGCVLGYYVGSYLYKFSQWLFSSNWHIASSIIK